MVDGDRSRGPTRNWAGRAPDEDPVRHWMAPVFTAFVVGMWLGSALGRALTAWTAVAWLVGLLLVRALAEYLDRRRDSHTAWSTAGTALLVGTTPFVTLGAVVALDDLLGGGALPGAVGLIAPVVAAVGQWWFGIALGRRLADGEFSRTVAAVGDGRADRSGVDRLLALLVASPLGRRETVVQQRPEVKCDECHRWHVPGVDRTTIEGVAGRPVAERTETLCEHCHEDASDD